ncbi:purine nucleoside phosphoramidase [Antarctobacter heliothermus]|uniref:Purine nucleoside phosphoramidase n=1 Tax=Antarctobacter heliothermus TaxID=74033 RepID=A0A222E017_9RHOB|nr:histidine triad nucleotide-binding protein [Antarctobacter heliothermus]ASP19536.1 purine nucleoside phosphoramidase [Antarctobacter heliothermus]MBT53202.1 histidine triad nucleotide-binding protein [Mameliella sp.]|tara:strand:- start:1890 stop:2258 length:369 start_codon:yes stop_codon:yes gene_type:complete
MAYTYDPENIFAKILTGDIPNKTVLETEHTLAFRDIYPQAPVHVLVIPKGPYVCYDHFAQDASDAEILDFTRTVGEVCKMEGLEADGFRLIANAGVNGVQEVPHLHVHILSGRPLGRMLDKA